MGNTPKIINEANENLRDVATGYIKQPSGPYTSTIVAHPTKMELAIPLEKSIKWVSLPNLEQIGEVTFDAPVSSIEYGVDGILTVVRRGTIHLFDGQEQIVEIEANAYRAIASKSNQRIVVETHDEETALYDFDGNLLWSVNVTEELDLGWHSSGQIFQINENSFVSTLGERFAVWEDAELDLPYRGDATGKTPEPNAMLLSPDGTELFEVQGTGTHVVYDAATLEQKRKLVSEDVQFGRYLLDGRVALWSNQQISIWDGESQTTYPTQWNGLWNYQVAPDGNHVWFRSHLNDLYCLKIDVKPEQPTRIVDHATISEDGKYVATVERVNYGGPFTMCIRDMKGTLVASYDAESSYSPDFVGFTPTNDVLFGTQWADEGKDNTFKLSLDGTVKSTRAAKPYYKTGETEMLNLPSGDAWDDDDKVDPVQVWNFEFETIDTFEVEGAKSYEDPMSSRFISFCDAEWDTKSYDRKLGKTLNMLGETVSGKYLVWDDWDEDQTAWYNADEERRVNGGSEQFYTMALSAKHDKIFFVNGEDCGFVWKADTAPERFHFIDLATIPDEDKEDTSYGFDDGQLDVSLDGDFIFHTNYSRTVRVFDAKTNAKLCELTVPFDPTFVLCSDRKLVLIHTYGLTQSYDLAQ